MFMKRITVVVLCFILICNLAGITTASAAQLDDQIIVSQVVEYINESDYIIETIYEPNIQPYSNTKTGTKQATYYYSGTAIFSVSVTGTFTYDGTSAQATSATKTIVGHVSDATYISSSAYTSGASAIATGSVSYKGFTLQKTVTLTCDKNGNLS